MIPYLRTVRLPSPPTWGIKEPAIDRQAGLAIPSYEGCTQRNTHSRSGCVAIPTYVGEAYHPPHP